MNTLQAPSPDIQDEAISPHFRFDFNFYHLDKSNVFIERLLNAHFKAALQKIVTLMLIMSVH